MKISLTPSQLARQLPELRLAIIQTYEGDIKIEGREILENNEFAPIEDEYSILKDFPSFAEIFTPKELKILGILLNTKVSRSELKVHISNKFSNVVEVHLKNIRRKIERYNLGIRVITFGKTGFVTVQIV